MVMHVMLIEWALDDTMQLKWVILKKSQQGGVRRPIVMCLIKDTFWTIAVRGPLKQQRTLKKVVPPGVKPRASGLSCRHSATELQHPLTTTSLSHPYDSLEVTVWIVGFSSMHLNTTNVWMNLYRLWRMQLRSMAAASGSTWTWCE